MTSTATFAVVLARTLARLAAVFALALLPRFAGAEEIIDPRTGHLTLAVSDLVIADGATRIELRRALRPGAGAPGLLGRAWRLDWESRLTRLEDIAVLDEVSGPLIFSRSGTPREYRAGSGERLVLEDGGRAVRHRLDETTETFDVQGRLVGRADRNGNAVSLTYGSDGRLARITGPRGAVVDFASDGSGRLTGVRTSNGQSLEYAYDGDALTETRVNGNVRERYGYDARGNLVRIEDVARGTIELAYDARGRVASRRWADGAVERYDYDDTAGTVRLTEPGGAVTAMRWSEDRRRAEVTDPQGGKSTLLYDAAGRLASVTGPTGAASRVTYDAAGRLSTVQNAAGQVTRYEYVGSSLRYHGIVRPDGTRQSFEYDSRGNLTASTIDAHNVALYTYHPDGSIATVRGAGEPEIRFGYRADGRIESVSNAAGDVTRFEYDARGNRVRTIDPLGGVTLHAYDAQDRLVSVTDASGATTGFKRDAAGRVTAMTDALGAVTRYEYDARGRLIAETDPAGQTTRSEYDGAGRLARRSFPDGSAETFRHDALGQIIAAVDRQGRNIQLDYDPLGRVVRERTAAGLATDYRYDAAGALLAQQDSLGAGPARQYDPAGRLTELKWASGAAVRFSYDALGRLVAAVDPLGHATRYQYGADGTLSEVRAADGSAARYGYDPAGRLTSVRHPGGGETRFRYDSAGNALQVTDPGGRAVQRTYDSVGRVATLTRRDGQAIAYRYDMLGRMIEKRLPGGTRVTYEYDVHGNLLKADDGTFPVVYTRDAAGRVTQIEYPALRKSLRYEYGATGLVSRMTDGDGGVTRYAYDAAGRPTTLTLPGGQAITFTYDARNRLTTTRYPNGVTGRAEYDAQDRVSALTYSDAAGKVLAGWRYSFDLGGNRIETASADGSATRYRYDAAGQLIEEAVAGQPPTRYSYLPGGNRERRESDGQSAQYRYDAADRLLEAGAESFAYDAHGNLTERRGPKGTTRYEYDAENRLVKVVPPNGGEVSFGYAPTGARVWRRDANGITYFLTDGINVLAELDEKLNTRATFVHALAIDAPLSMTREGRHYFFHRERLGSIKLLTGERGEVAASYDYDAFGALKRAEGKLANPFTFTARELEPSIGLYYYRARYYDPQLGRFLSVDPLPPPLESPLELNPYLYARNNPLRFIDPLGTDWLPEEKLWLLHDSLERMRRLAENPAPLPPGSFRDDYLRRAAQLVTEIDEFRGKYPGVGEPTPPPGYAGRPFPGQSPAAATGEPRPAGRGGPTQAVPREQPAAPRAGSNTQAVRPPAGSGADAGTGAPWGSIGRVAGGVVGGATSVANIAACMNDPRLTAAQCAGEAGLIVLGTAGGALILATPAAAAAIAAAPVTVGVIAVTLAASGAYQATNRLIDSANAPASIAEAARQAELEARFKKFFPGFQANTEAKVAAFERKASAGAAGPAREAANRAAEFAGVAASNLAALKADLSQAAAFCGIANSLRGELDALGADADKRLSSLDTGLTAAAGMVSQCTSRNDATWAKDLYQTGIGMVAEMVVRAQRAERAQGALQEARTVAERALAGAQQRAQMIAGNAELAQQAAAQARSAAHDRAAARQSLERERTVLDGEIDAYRNWFPPRPEVEQAIGGWKRRVAAALATAQASGADDAAAGNTAELDAVRAASRRDEGLGLLSEARARVEGCAQDAAVAVSNATTTTIAANAAAAGTLNRFSELPSLADTCIARLDAPASPGPSAATPPQYNPLADPNLAPPSRKPPRVAATDPGRSIVPPPPEPPGAPPQPPRPLGGDGKPIPPAYTGDAPARPAAPSTTTAAAIPLTCWSDQLQAYQQVLGYACPPTVTRPTGPPPRPDTGPGRSPPRWTDIKPAGPVHSGPGAGGGGSGAGGPSSPGSPPTAGATPPKAGAAPVTVAQGPAGAGGAQKAPAGGQCRQPLCHRADQTDCERGPLPQDDGWVPACYANMLARCQQGEAGGTGAWCVRKGADPSCEVRARRVCGGVAPAAGGKAPPAGPTCGPATTCTCAGGGRGHIPCDNALGISCHCGAG